MRRKLKALAASIPLIFTIWQSTPTPIIDYAKQLVQVSTKQPLRQGSVTPSILLDKLPTKAQKSSSRRLVRHQSNPRRDRKSNPKPKNR
jgi:hypothetical protein